MIVACGGCGKRYRFDEAKLGGRTSAVLRCPNCKGSIAVTGPARVGDQTTRLDADAAQLPASAKVPKGSLAMPPSRRISIAVLAGKESGRIFIMDRPQVTIGRSDADIVLDDPEVSRQHVALEVHGPRIVLRDLGSTNGTFVDDVKISQMEIQNRAEFRIGSTRLMLILIDTESDLEPVS
ncbi:MAG: FHA domain-containing protein [Acidobacteriota bacterium]